MFLVTPSGNKGECVSFSNSQHCSLNTARHKFHFKSTLSLSKGLHNVLSLQKITQISLCDLSLTFLHMCTHIHTKF